MILDDDVEHSADEFDRRSISRTWIAKGASLFFSSQSGVHACLVRDVTNVGAGDDAALLPDSLSSHTACERAAFPDHPGLLDDYAALRAILFLRR